ESLNKHEVTAEAPKNLITVETSRITPELLPLIDITQDDIDSIVNRVEGGVANIQDIYALSPLQEGILFHHTMATVGDLYLISTQLSFDDRATLDRYLDAMQKVIDRHDILRTAFMWENLSTPAQVVLRHATLSVTELKLDPSDGPITDQIAMLADPKQHRIDLALAPLIRYMIAQDIDGKWAVVELNHHLISDHSTLEIMQDEIKLFMNDQAHQLLEPEQFRKLIAHVKAGPSPEVYKSFFTEMLGDIDTPALPYGLSSVHEDGHDVSESFIMLPQNLNDRLRGHAQRIGVSLASMCHLAWAQVISKTSGQEKVVFGTVLFGRLQGGSGSDRAMGMFINTLPLRIDVGDRSVEDSVRKTQADLAALLEHEHASLAMAQRCSSVTPSTPLFSSLLNYRHNSEQSTQASDNNGFKFISAQERTNYPFTISVEDGGNTLGLTAQTVKQFDPTQLCEYMQMALESLADALDHSPGMQVRKLEVLPSLERELLLRSWNATE
ncbi:hypothetical protein BGX27_004623, partial [Mortierella sp. AM989]